MENTGICPVCNGTCRVPIPEESKRYKSVIASYDPETDTLACNNCGGQTMYGKPTGKVKLRADGSPCKHEYDYKQLGRCYHGYTCKHCGFFFDIDSGD